LFSLVLLVLDSGLLIVFIFNFRLSIVVGVLVLNILRVIISKLILKLLMILIIERIFKLCVSRIWVHFRLPIVSAVILGVILGVIILVILAFCIN
jgi:hypothetical protein